MEFETFVVFQVLMSLKVRLVKMGSSSESEAPIVSYPQWQESIATSRPKRDIWKPARYANMVAFAFPVIDDSISSTYKQAFYVPESGEWKKSMDEKINSFHKNQT